MSDIQILCRIEDRIYDAPREIEWCDGCEAADCNSPVCSECAEAHACEYADCGINKAEDLHLEEGRDCDRGIA